MNQSAIDAVFRPKLNTREVKADDITRNVRAILNAEASKRDTKTERLRAERLAWQASQPAKPAAKPRQTARRVK